MEDPRHYQGKRRKSISFPELNLLLTLANHSWDHKPEKDYFDELVDVEAGRLKKGRERHKSDLSEVNSDPEETSSSQMTSQTETSPSIEEDEDEIEALKSPFHQKFKGLINRERRKSYSSEEEEIYEFKKTPLATRRKSGVVPLIDVATSKSIKADLVAESDESCEEQEPSPRYPVNTRTFSFMNDSRFDKIHKVIRGKLQTVSVFKRKSVSNTDFKLPAFIIFLLVTILFLISAIYVIHNEKEMKKGFFDQIRFSDSDRKFRVINEKGIEVLSGILGVNLGKKDKPWPCHQIHRRANESCLEWMNKGRLHFQILESRTEETSLQCYGILWERLDPNFQLKDCFHISDKKGYYWYGAGEIGGSISWPLNRSHVPYGPFITGKGMTFESGEFQWGRILNRYFLSAPGAAIRVSPETPLHISINDGGGDDSEQMICLGAKWDEFAFPLNRDKKLYLNYTICSGENVREVAEKLADKKIWDGLNHDDVHSTYALVKSPIWRIRSEAFMRTRSFGNSSNTELISEAALLNYTDRIAALQLSEGFILLDKSWQKNIGDLDFDLDKYPTMAETLNLVHRRGFKVAKTIHPFFSTESENYIEGLHLGIWTKERDRSARIPTLTNYWSSVSVAYLDISEPRALEWFERKANAFVDKYHIDKLFAQTASAHEVPHYYEFSGKKLDSVDSVKEHFLKSVRNIKNCTIIASNSAVKLPKLPTFVHLSPVESSFDGLRSVVSNMLNVGISGYPFIIPGAIGGDFGFGLDWKPSRNLYIRWLEMAHFMPVIEYSFIPSDYDKGVIEIASKYNQIRKTKIFPYIKKAIDEALTSGMPIIRPLWTIDPTDAHCLRIWDEFMIGNDILVAPILEEGSTERDIYLPKGKWRNEIDNSNSKGERWLHHAYIREDQIAFFTRIE